MIVSTRYKIIGIISVDGQIDLESCPEMKSKTSTYDWLKHFFLNFYDWLKNNFFMINHGVISILTLYENIRLQNNQQEIIELCLQVLVFEVVGPDVRKNKHSLFNLSNLDKTCKKKISYR